MATDGKWGSPRDRPVISPWADLARSSALRNFSGPAFPTPWLAAIVKQNSPLLSGAFKAQVTSLITPQLSLTNKALYANTRRSTREPRSSRGAEEYFAHHEVTINSERDLLDRLARTLKYHHELELVWRGQQDASWGVSSSLHRWLKPSISGDVTEDHLVSAEIETHAEAHRWGLYLPPLPLLADLQHQGAPTRLIDASRDHNVAAWFAVEAHEKHDDKDARILAFGTRPLVKDGRRHVVGQLHAIDPTAATQDLAPFWHAWQTEDERLDAEWGSGTRLWSWFPAAHNERMRAQRAGFLLNGMPEITDDVADVISESLGEPWRPREIAAATDLLALPSQHDKRTSPNSANIIAVFSFRIPAELKPKIRGYLNDIGYKPQDIYPDLAGLAAHLTSSKPGRS